MLSGHLMTVLDTSDVVRPAAIAEMSEADVIDAVREGDYTAIIRIPSDYSERTLAGEEALPLVTLEPNSEGGRTAKQAIEAAFQRLLGAVETARAATETAEETIGFADEAATEAFFRETIA